MPHAMPGRAPFPRAMLIGAGLVIAATLALVTLGRVTPANPAAGGVPALQSRDLRFADAPNGGVRVTDARSGETLLLIASGEDGFLRGAMRGLARDRRTSSHDDAMPFRLTRWADGRLTLEDTATSRMLELRAFGQTNADAFQRFLSTKE